MFYIFHIACFLLLFSIPLLPTPLASPSLLFHLISLHFHILYLLFLLSLPFSHHRRLSPSVFLPPIYFPLFISPFSLLSPTPCPILFYSIFINNISTILCCKLMRVFFHIILSYNSKLFFVINCLIINLSFLNLL